MVEKKQELVFLAFRVPKPVKRRLKLVALKQDTTAQAFATMALELALAAAEKKAA